MIDVETYTKWDFGHPVSSQIYCESVMDDSDGFRVLLASRDPSEGQIVIRVPGLVAYRNSNESQRLRALTQAAEEDGPLYRVNASKFIEWLVTESEGTLSEDRLVHYAIFTAEDCIDIIADIVPSVSFER